MKCYLIILLSLLCLPVFGQKGFFWSHTAVSGGFVAPTVTTSAATNVASTTATLNGSTTEGSATINQKGFAYGTSSNPDISGTHTHDGGGSGSYTSDITSLSSCTTYHVRSYATTVDGTYYGDDVTFNTTVPSGLTQYAFYWEYEYPPYTFINFSTSQSAAESACSLYGTPDYTWYGKNVKASSLTVGQAVYNVSASPCVPLADGYYLYVASAPYQIIHVVSGAISSVTDCSEILPKHPK